MSTISDSDHIDGNGAAGPFSEALGIDATTAVLTCARCARPSRFAEAHVYDGAGLVARCPECTSVLARLVRTPTEAWLDLRGAASMRVALPGGTPR